MKKLSLALSLVLLVCALAGCNFLPETTSSTPNENIITIDTVPDFSGAPYVVINGGNPDFTDSQLKAESFENYSPLDLLGRAGVATACIGKDIMPTEERGSIGQVKPTGWHTVKYDCVDGKYLYNRCHLIGYQLTGENANEQNLITGTRYMNVEGMLPFENMVADYVKETENHVLYRVTPVYDGANLLARGVQIEAKSVEDGGEGICFNVYVYNVQPQIIIDYATGESKYETDSSETYEGQANGEYILNTNSKKFHLPDCGGAKNISDKNKQLYSGTRDSLINDGYTPCKTCNP